jgi:hypothetical protein
MAAHPGNREALVSVAEEMAVVIEEEQPGSGPREAALETLEKLSQNEKCLEEMADMAGLLPALVNATKSEAQGAVGRESALTVMQRLQAAQVRPRANTQEQTEDQVSGLVDTCLDSVAKEPKGSGAKMVAIKTLRDVAKGPFRGLLMAKPGLLDQILGAARTESPGGWAVLSAWPAGARWAVAIFAPRVAPQELPELTSPPFAPPRVQDRRRAARRST